MKLLKILSIVSLLTITGFNTLAADKAPSHLNQVRNSLWVFGVDNGLTSEVELIGQEFSSLTAPSASTSADQQYLDVPEELGLAFERIDS